MARQRRAVDGYDAITERWRRRRLGDACGAVYHSPNHFLPQQEGLKVAAVRDLSNYSFPETHPAARSPCFELAFERSLCRADVMITESEAVRRRYPLLLTGAPGWLDRPIGAAVGRGGAAGWLRFLGYVPEAELPLAYTGAHALAMISVCEDFDLPVP